MTYFLLLKNASSKFHTWKFSRIIIINLFMFIIKLIKRRCLCSDNVDGCCAMFNNCTSALESIYRDYFYSKLKSGYLGGFDITQAYTAIKRSFQNPDQTERQKINFLITLNNIEESIECLSTMKKLFEVIVTCVFSQVKLHHNI